MKLVCSVAAAVLSLLLAGSVASADQAPVNECEFDEDCGAGAVCVGGNGTVCYSIDAVCATSDDCASGSICNLFASSCPPNGDRCADEPWGFCDELPDAYCAGDSDCGTEELCWVTEIRECASGDTACEEPGYTTCVDWARLCGGPIQCAAQETCVAGRCVAQNYESYADDIDVDQGKEDRLRPLWEEGYCATHPDRCPEPEGGCNLAGGSAPLGTAAMLLLIAVLIGRRRAGESR